MRGVLALASFTGWGLNEIKSLPVSEFFKWVKLLPKDNGK